MNLEQRPEHRLEQKLNAQLILNLKLLQLPFQELQQTIELELQENPALEMVETSGDTSDEIVDTSGDTSLPDTDEFDLAELLPPDFWDTPGPSPSSDIIETSGDTSLPAELTPDNSSTLRDTLLPKLLAQLPSQDAPVAERLLEFLDEDGRLTSSEHDLLVLLGVAEEQLQRILKVLRGIPPGGIGCRTTREILLTQLELNGIPRDALQYKLLSEGWEMLLHPRKKQLRRLGPITVDELRQALRAIKFLDPRPARQFTDTTPDYVRPDFSIQWSGDTLIPVPQDESLPRLRVAKQFLEMVQHPKDYHLEQVRFAREKVKNALMLLKALESRRRLLRRLMELLLNTQKQFFLYGGQFLKPATLSQTAVELGVSPSTISRAIAGKYIETPFGIFPLKNFFKTGKSDRARTSIKEKIRELIEAEDKDHPLSDDNICSLLAQQGIKISRRTVAKYRAELGIPPAHIRLQSSVFGPPS